MIICIGRRVRTRRQKHLNTKRALLSTEQPQIYIRDDKRHGMNGNSLLDVKVVGKMNSTATLSN